jgi:Skp family chaperone for outer membrane proteins
MNKLLLSAALAVSLGAGSAANAQAIPGAIIAVVDLGQVTGECTACKAAAATLRSRVAALQTREKALTGPLETEQKSIQAAVDALAGKEPDAALQARAKAWETKRQQAAQELQRSQQQLQRDNAYISQQIEAKLSPIYKQVMQKRGANLMVSADTTLATSSSIEVTSDVLAALNAALPSVQTNAPAQAAATTTQQPQGR